MKGDRTYQKMWKKAQAAANAASEAAKPVPMIVQQHANQMDDNSPVIKQWFVEGGVCGFGWVEVKPRTSKFARWLKARNYGGSSDYSKSIHLHVPGMTQSLARNEAAARAMAEVLVAGLAEVGETETMVYAQSRID